VFSFNYVVELVPIHKDERGEILAVKGLLEDNREFTFLGVKAGFARGGCLHTEDEWFVVINGKIKVVIGNEEKLFSKGESALLPKGTPHAFVGVEDSIVAEWGIKTQEKENDIKDKELREKVDSINKQRRGR